jgi:outer membrane biogenesis lipoprotein LolB
MRFLLPAVGLLALAACTTSKYHELAHTSTDDPIWVLNESRLPLNPNNLAQAPVVSAARTP